MKKRSLLTLSIAAMLSLVMLFGFNSRALAYSYGNYYTNGYTNVREEPNGRVIHTLKPGEKVFCEYNYDSNWYYIDHNEVRGYIYKNLVQDSPLQFSGYIKKGSNIRDYFGDFLFTTNRPIFVSGKVSDGKLEFTIDDEALNFESYGSYGYVHYSCLQKSSPAIKGYVKYKANARSTPNGRVIGTINKGQYINGRLVGNWIKFTRNGRTNYVHHSNFSANRVPAKVYIIKGSNIRNLRTGKVIENLKVPLYVEGYYFNNTVRFTYKGKNAYVSSSLTRLEGPIFYGYTKTGANIRWSDGDFYGIMPKGTKFFGRFEGNNIRLYREGFGDEQYYLSSLRIHRSTVRPR